MLLLTLSINNISEKKYKFIYDNLECSRKTICDKLKSENAKKRFLAGEFLLMDGLKKFGNINYKNTFFKYNSNGKPYIDENIYFNISHSDDLVVCGFSTKEIGVDVERVRRTRIDTSKAFATEKERKYIFKSALELNKRLFQIYTLKEAYFKMLGGNLFNLKSVEFTIKKKMILVNDSKVWATLKYLNDYVIAICERY